MLNALNAKLAVIVAKRKLGVFSVGGLFAVVFDLWISAPFHSLDQAVAERKIEVTSIWLISGAQSSSRGSPLRSVHCVGWKGPLMLMMVKDLFAVENLVAIVVAAVVVAVSVYFLTRPKGKEADLRSQLKSARQEIRTLLDLVNCGEPSTIDTTIRVRVQLFETGIHQVAFLQHPQDASP